MSVRALSLHSLPRVQRANTAGADILRARRAVLGRSVGLKLSSLGDVTFTCANVVASAHPDEGDTVWTLSRPGNPQRGYLLLQGLTALRLVKSTLGLPPARILRELGTAERGIAAAIVAGVLRAAGSDVVVRLGRQRWRGGGLVRLIITMTQRDFTDFVRADVPLDWLTPSVPISLLDDASRMGLEIPMRIELARTRLTASDWSGACVGDAVVFDGAVPHRSGQPLQALLVCGQLAAAIQINPGGEACLNAGFQWRTRNAAASAWALGPKKETNMSVDSTPIDALTLLAAAPIEVVAEIGRLVMRADEITALHPGSVLALGLLTPHIVDIKIGDRSWAQGELVDVDGQLGVRLTSINPLPQNRK